MRSEKRNQHFVVQIHSRKWLTGTFGCRVMGETVDVANEGIVIWCGRRYPGCWKFYYPHKNISSRNRQ